MGNDHSCLKEPKVAVIIPAYNAQKTLKVCLDSVLKQDYGNFEVIVVDNGSTDRTKDIIMTSQASDSRVRYIFEPRKSRGAARNAGIDQVKGEIIAMIDSDCIAPNDWLRSLSQLIIEGREVIVMGCEGDTIKNFWTRNIQEHNAIFFERYRRGEYILMLDTKNFAIKTAIMKEYMFDESIGNLEDIEFALRIRHKLRIRFLSTVKVWHYHKASFFSWLRLQFDRGYWATRIYWKHKETCPAKSEVIFASMTFKSFLSWPIWLICESIKKPLMETWFTFVSDVGWRSGLIWGFLLKKL